MKNPADSGVCFSFEQDAGDSGGEAEEMMNLFITQSLTEDVAAFTLLICTH